MRFVYPWVLLLLVTLVPFFIWYYFFSKIKRESFIRYTRVKDLGKKGRKKKWKILDLLPKIPDILKVLALVFVIIALARPQLGQRYIDRYAEGYDIILTLDCSQSMAAQDFKPNNRLTVSKNVISKFIKGRKEDRIGLVLFGSESYAQVPLTLDYNMLQQALKNVRFGIVDGSSTAIGMGIVNSVNRLRHSKAKNKLVVLLTDGVNNAGAVDPLTAARIAQALDIKIYTIGVGSKGKAYIEMDTPQGRQSGYIDTDIDEASLTEVALITGGQYFRAFNPSALEEIYARIDKLEKTKFKVREYVNYNDIFSPYVWIALLLLLSALLVRDFLLRRIP